MADAKMMKDGALHDIESSKVMKNGILYNVELIRVKKGGVLYTVWEFIKSCFGRGFWINDRPWNNTDGWKNN